MVNDKLRIVVIGTKWSSSSVTHSLIDSLTSVGRDWNLVHGDLTGEQLFNVQLLNLDGAPYRDPNGRQVIPDGAFFDCKTPNIVIVPDLHVDPKNVPYAEFDAYVDWLRSSYQKGAILSSVCSGSLLLAQTQLLDGQVATTHWAYADLLAQRYPSVRMNRERLLVGSGEGGRLITSGGASSWAELVLYLTSRFASEEEARRIAKIYLLRPTPEGQMQYASLMSGFQHNDAMIGRLQAWLGENYSEQNPVSSLVTMSGLSRRGFLSRFRKATGVNPMEYLQLLRVEEAKHLLETSDESIEEIAAQVGYQEGSSLRQIFRKHVGMTASAYRRRFRTDFRRLGRN